MRLLFFLWSGVRLFRRNGQPALFPQGSRTTKFSSSKPFFFPPDTFPGQRLSPLLWPPGKFNASPPWRKGPSFFLSLFPPSTTDGSFHDITERSLGARDTGDFLRLVSPPFSASSCGKSPFPHKDFFCATRWPAGPSFFSGPTDKPATASPFFPPLTISPRMDGALP